MKGAFIDCVGVSPPASVAASPHFSIHIHALESLAGIGICRCDTHTHTERLLVTTPSRGALFSYFLTALASYELVCIFTPLSADWPQLTGRLSTRRSKS